MDSRLDTLTFIAIDTETTGTSPRLGDRIIEIGAVRFTVSGVTDRWETTIWPHRPISPGAQRVHGLSLDSLHHAPCFPEIVDNFLDFVGDAVVVMHNAPFDTRFLAVHLAETGHRWQPVIFDTLRLLRRNFSLPRNSLAAAVHHFGIRSTPNHRAIADAEATAQLFRAILARKMPRTLDDLLALHGGPFAVPVLDLPPDDMQLTTALERQDVVEVEYETRPGPIVGRIEGIASGEGGSYCTIRVQGGKRLILRQDRIRSIRVVGGTGSF